MSRYVLCSLELQRISEKIKMNKKTTGTLAGDAERHTNMRIYDLIATSTFGLESVVADELKLLGHQNLES